MAPYNPRLQALLILNDLENRRKTLDGALSDRRRDIARLDRRDHALMQTLVYGVLRWRSRLDAAIDTCLTNPKRRMPTDIRNILRLGFYQLSDLDRIPASAAVHTAVELAKAVGKKPMAGFVNAVLRSAQREGGAALLETIDASPSATPAVKHAMPDWLWERWVDRYGQSEAEALCKGMNRLAPLVGRVNTLRVNRKDLSATLASAGISAQATLVSPDGLRISGLTTPIAELPAIQRGELRIQDEGAQLITHLLDPQPGEHILDACAGRGGKTGHIAQRMLDRGRLIAVDNDPHRLAQLTSDMPRLGITCAEVRKCDLNHPLPKAALPLFDRILVDAPCSGLGVIRRNPDTKWSRRPSDLPRYAQRQGRFLDHLAPLVKPSGILLYAVCSLEYEENSMVIDVFLKRHPMFSLRPVSSTTVFGSHGLVDADGCFRSMPHRHDMDGFFAAILIRDA